MVWDYVGPLAVTPWGPETIVFAKLSRVLGAVGLFGHKVGVLLGAPCRLGVHFVTRDSNRASRMGLSRESHSVVFVLLWSRRWP
jgi:hypothetical protein